MNIELGDYDDELGDYKSISLAPSDAALVYNHIKDQCLYLANQFAEATSAAFKGAVSEFDMRVTVANREYCLGTRSSYKNRFDTIEDIYSDSFKCSYSYNSACHCHPEYNTFTQSFSQSVATSFSANDSKTISLYLKGIPTWVLTSNPICLSS